MTTFHKVFARITNKGKINENYDIPQKLLVMTTLF